MRKQDMDFDTLMETLEPHKQLQMLGALTKLAATVDAKQLAEKMDKFKSLMANREQLNHTTKVQRVYDLFPELTDIMDLIVPKKIRGFEVLPDAVPYVQAPQRETRKAAGYDIRALESAVIPIGGKVTFKTGLTVYCQDDEFLDLRIRSGLAYNHDLTLQNDAGVIDADFYGKEIKVMIRNEGKKPYQVFAGERIAQGIFSPFLLDDNDNPSDTERTDGLGHTGKK